MATKRKELQDALCRYFTDTLSDIVKISKFCEKSSDWISCRKKESDKIMHIKNMDDNVTLHISDVSKSEKKREAFKKYMKSKFTPGSADHRHAELKDELEDVLKDTLKGLEKLDYFLDAVEKLAVTSLHVFVENQALHLSTDIRLEDVQVVIAAARRICPRLLEFKRDVEAFFFPKMQNVEVLKYQLDKYIETTEKICDEFNKSSISELSLNLTVETLVHLDVDLSEDEICQMLKHSNQLGEIRMNQAFRMVFLFQEEPCSEFINEFSQRQPRMLQFLKELEEVAVQLDKMYKGAKISSVAGSSVGAVGGGLSIAGLVLAPFTAGLSLALTVTGVGLGITSGVNGLVTTATELGVNYKQQKKANEVFQSFMEDVQTIKGCLEHAMERDTSEIHAPLGATKAIKSVAASAVKVLKGKDLVNAGKSVAQEGKALRILPRVASDIPDIGQAAVKAPLAITKTARAGLMAANALFVGMDIFFICKDSRTLSKGAEAEMSRTIRARAELWNSEIESWQKIHDLLNEGLLKSEKSKVILKTQFYSEMKNTIRLRQK